MEALNLEREPLDGRGEVRFHATGAQQLSGSWAHVVGYPTGATAPPRLPPLLSTLAVPTLHPTRVRTATQANAEEALNLESELVNGMDEFRVHATGAHRLSGS